MRSGRGKRGVTLTELVVVLVVMGLAAALAAPAIVAPSRESDLSIVLNSARRTALRRAETVDLDYTRSGGWRISSRTLSPRVLSRLEPRLSRDARVSISPLGACVVERGSVAPAGVSINPLACSLDSAGLR